MGRVVMVSSIYLEELKRNWSVALGTWAQNLERVALRSFNEVYRMDAPPGELPVKHSFSSVDELVHHFSRGREGTPWRLWMESYEGRQRVDVSPQLSLILKEASPVMPFYQLYAEIAVSSDQLLNRTIVELSELFEKNAAQMGKVVYGLMHIMRTSDLPMFYFSDISTDKLSPDLIQNLQVWRKEKKACASRVRDVYAGNIWTSSHLGDKYQELLDQIVREVGPKNVVVDDDRIIVALPTTFRQWISGEREVFEVRERLRSLFRREGRLMTGEMLPVPVPKGGAHAGAEAEPSNLARANDRSIGGRAPESARRPTGHRQRLMQKIRMQGLPSVVDAGTADVEAYLATPRPLPVVSLEDFFEGNDDEGSIGVNLSPHPGLPKFFQVLARIRDRRDVQDVLVEIWEVDESDADAWPFSERVYVLTRESDGEKVLEWFAELSPDGGIESGYAAGTPAAAPPLRKSYLVWSVSWD